MSGRIRQSRRRRLKPTRQTKVRATKTPEINDSLLDAVVYCGNTKKETLSALT
jgi:hypothetical protein